MSGQSNVLIISADCHAGALPGAYKEYMPSEFHEANDTWWLTFVREMISRQGTFFDQEAVEDFVEQTGESGAGRANAILNPPGHLDDDALRAMLEDENNPFAPKRGEWDAAVRLEELEEDGIAGEIIFPQMAPFGAGLMQYRNPIDPQLNLEGNRAYNRWLADLCNANPGRHAGVAIINVDDMDVTVQEIRDAKEMGLWGGVLLPTSTGEQPFYHHPLYEPLWAVCEELDMPVHTHSGWSPDYGDLECSTAMYISEVDMWAQRPFKALLWSGAFERHPDLKFVMTETGSAWIVETLRVLEFKVDNPLFKHFTKELSLRPSEYFERQCFIGASFLPAHEGKERHRVGVDKLMWGSDYPHMEGTWPHTMDSLRETFSGYPEDEARKILGTTAAEVYGFDLDILGPVGEKIGPALSEITNGS
ncbi:MAG: amidohydrolase family protein [Myxococcota bacterium]